MSSRTIKQFAERVAELPADEQWRLASAAYRARHPAITWGAYGPIHQAAWEQFHRYFEGWLKAGKGDTMVYIPPPAQGSVVSIHLATMTFGKRTISAMQAELWAQVMHPGEPCKVFDLFLKRHFAAFSEYELLLLYQNTAGKPCAPGDYGRIVLLCSELAQALPTDMTSVEELRRQLGPQYNPSSLVVSTNAPWLDDANNPSEALPGDSTSVTVAARSEPLTTTPQEIQMSKPKSPAAPAAPAAPGAAPPPPPAAAKKKAPATPKAPAAPKAEKPPKVVKEKVAKVEQNGIVRPKAGGKCAAVWDLADQISKKNKKPAESGEVMEAAKAAKLNEANARAEFQRWRKFNGLSKPVVAAK